MAYQQFVNAAQPSCLLASAYTAGDGTMSVDSAANLPANPNYTLRLDDEFFLVTAQAGSGPYTLTVLGAQEGSTAANHANAAPVYCILSAATLENILADMSQVGLYAGRPVSATGARKGMRYRCSDAAFEYIFDGTSWVELALGGSEPGSRIYSGAIDPGVPVIAFVQSVAFGPVAGGCAFVGDVTAGNLLLAAIEGETASWTAAGITDSQGNTWAQADTAAKAFTYSTGQLWFAVASASGPCTVTWAGAATIGVPTMILAEFAGASGVIDVRGQGSSPQALTTTVSYDLAITDGDGINGDMTVSGGTTLVLSHGYGSRWVGLAYEVVPVAGSYTASVAMTQAAFSSTAFKPTPPPNPGSDGDLYLNLTSGHLFLKNSGVWNDTGKSLT